MSDKQPPRSLQDLIDSVPSIVAYLYNETVPPHCRNNPKLSPVPVEFSNWREEQRAWRETAVLFDQSHHMPELFLKGRDALRLLNNLGINSLANLTTSRAKQFVACNFRGHIIGDCILHNLGPDSYELVSGMTLQNWVHYHAETGGYDVSVVRDPATTDDRSRKRTNFRFGLDGPNAGKIFDEVVDGQAPDIPFFNTARIKIRGCEVLALRHGMAGHRGVELSGAYDQGPIVRAALLEDGEKFGLLPGGQRTYFSSSLESGWIGYPLPAIYTGDDLRGFREWLPVSSWESRFALGGSFYTEDIEQYYVTPFDMGYGSIVNFDHDFIGRAALERLKEKPPRSRITLVWDHSDVERIYASLFEPGLPFKYLDLPVADYAMPQYDQVRHENGQLIGLSMHCGYSINEQKVLSLALMNSDHATPGTKVEVLWGEPNGGSKKKLGERHRQTVVRATVAPAPYAQSVNAMKRATLSASAE